MEVPTITKEEIKLLKADGRGSSAVGYLRLVREGQSLEQVHDEAMADPHQTEHRARYQKTYDYLDTNRQLFGIAPRSEQNCE